MLDFLHEQFTTGVAYTTLRIYMANAKQGQVDSAFLGRHSLLSSFIFRVRQLRPSHLPSIPSWDLSVLLEGHSGPAGISLTLSSEC